MKVTPAIADLILVMKESGRSCHKSRNTAAAEPALFARILGLGAGLSYSATKWTISFERRGIWGRRRGLVVGASLGAKSGRSVLQRIERPAGSYTTRQLRELFE